MIVRIGLGIAGPAVVRVDRRRTRRPLVVVADELCADGAAPGWPSPVERGDRLVARFPTGARCVRRSLLQIAGIAALRRPIVLPAAALSSRRAGSVPQRIAFHPAGHISRRLAALVVAVAGAMVAGAVVALSGATAGSSRGARTTDLPFATSTTTVPGNAATIAASVQAPADADREDVLAARVDALERYPSLPPGRIVTAVAAALVPGESIESIQVAGNTLTIVARTARPWDLRDRISALDGVETTLVTTTGAGERTVTLGARFVSR